MQHSLHFPSQQRRFQITEFVQNVRCKSLYYIIDVNIIGCHKALEEEKQVSSEYNVDKLFFYFDSGSKV